MTAPSLLWLFFPLAITLHNLEEALWLPRWSKEARRFHPVVEQEAFNFAVIVVTILAYLATFVAIAAPSFRLGQMIFYGALGTMILNVFMPHLLATIILRKYAPGLLTGLLLLIPINSTILAQAIMVGQLTWGELVVSTIVVAAILLSSLPLLFRLGRRVIKL